MSIDECTRSSLGRTATIGALYDVRTETLMLSNIFKDNIDEFIETKWDESSAGLKYDSFISTKTSEKLRKVGIDADASLSLLCGIVDASGSVDFVKDKTHSERAVQLNIVVSKTTKKDQINYKQPKLQEFYDFSGHEYATHVVVGITYGANATITFTDTNLNGHDKNKVTGKMSLELKKLETICPKLGNVSAHVNANDNDDNEEWKNEETKIAVHTDVPPADQSLPRTAEDAKKYIEKIGAEKVGKQQIFHLLPISSLNSFLQKSTNLDSKFASISSGKIHKIESLFDEIDECYGQIQDIWADINKTASIPRTEKYHFQDHMKEMANEIAEIKDDIRKLVLKVRTTDADPSVLDEKFNEIKSTSIASRLNFEDFLCKHQNVIERAKFLRECETKGAKTALDDIRLSEIKRNNIDKNIYILFSSFDRERNSDRVNCFHKLLMHPRPQDCFVVVETDSWSGKPEEIPKRATIQLIVDGKLVDDDYEPNKRYLNKKQFSMDELCKLLKKSGTFETNYSEFTNKTFCCVTVDNFTKDTLKFEGFEETRGYFVHTTEDKDISPGYRYSFVTRKMGLSWYGPAVTCAWRIQDYLIAASWQIPVAGSGYYNNVCVGITNPGITYSQISQENIEKILGDQKSNERAQHAINYYEGGKKSGFFSTIHKLVIDDDVEDQTIKNQDFKVKFKMTKDANCRLSIQVFPKNVNNFAPELISHVAE